MLIALPVMPSFSCLLLGADDSLTKLKIQCFPWKAICKERKTAAEGEDFSETRVVL